MTVNPNTNNQSLEISKTFLMKLKPNQKKVIDVLSSNPKGLLSNEFTALLCISNKADLINKMKNLLASEGLEIIKKRVSDGYGQWHWKLQRISSGERA